MATSGRPRGGAGKRCYAVDWDSDPECPQIVRVEDGEGKTFTEARREVVGFYTDLRDSAREMIKRLRALTPEDVEPREDGDAPGAEQAAAQPASDVDSMRPDGVALIAAERQRQVEAGLTGERDLAEDQRPTGNRELVSAAASYALARDAPMRLVSGPDRPPEFLPWQWPVTWTADDWEPSGDPVRDLTMAGALIAAEIDRLLAWRARTPAGGGPDA